MILLRDGEVAVGDALGQGGAADFAGRVAGEGVGTDQSYGPLVAADLLPARPPQLRESRLSITGGDDDGGDGLPPPFVGGSDDADLLDNVDVAE